MRKEQSARPRQARIRGAYPGLSLFALALLVLATASARGSPRIDQSAPPTGIRHASVWPSAAATEDCSTDVTLCLGDGRFLVGATWKTPEGQSGPAHAMRLTADSGYFWFLEPGNIELAVKTLNGCGVNNRYWFFSAGLTNLEVTISVTDTTTNVTKTYSNPQGVAFRPIADSVAFESCSVAARALSSDPEAPIDDASPGPPAVAPGLARRDAGSGCAGGYTAVLCLNGRFQVEATWQIDSGQSGSAHAVALTSEAGYFTFFDSSNVELIVKSLDASAMGQGQWFFAAGMTTVGVRLTVTDTLTGKVKIYANALGTAFQPVQDTKTFYYCSTDCPPPPPPPPPQGLSGTWTGTIAFSVPPANAGSDGYGSCLGVESITVDLVDHDGALTGQFHACGGMFAIDGQVDNGSISGSLSGGYDTNSGRIHGTASENRIQFETRTVFIDPDNKPHQRAYKSSTVELHR